MVRFVSRWPFTAIGLSTLALFLLSVALDRAGAAGAAVEALHSALRFLIVPMWVMRYLVVAVGLRLFGGGAGFPVWFDILTIPVLLLPYLALDVLVIRAWRDPHPGQARAS